MRAGLIAVVFTFTLVVVGIVTAQSASCNSGETCVYVPIAAADFPTSTTQPSAIPTATPTRTPTATLQPTATRDPAVCDPSYPTVCIPPPPPDLNCGDIVYRRFTVLQPDPHNFDTDFDGVGCETG